MMSYTQFTPEMRKTHTILVPNMLPIHFQLLISIFGQYGYHMKLLESSSRTVVEEGLKNVHNDTCYPALLVIGQFRPAAAAGLPITSTYSESAWQNIIRRFRSFP